MPCESSSGSETGMSCDGLSGKTYLEHSAATRAQTLQSWLARWQVWSSPNSLPKAGARKAPSLAPKQWSNGQSSTRNGSEWRKGAVACSLSQILETGTIDPRYFLSPKACAGILRRAEKRGKMLPTTLLLALQAVAGELRDPEIPGAKTASSHALMPATRVSKGRRVKTQTTVTATSFPSDCSDLF